MYTTSSAVSAAPLWNLTPWRILKVQTSAAEFADQLVASTPEALRTELKSLDAELDQFQGETPLMRICVDAHIVGDVVSAWTGIPIGRMLKNVSPGRAAAR